MRSFLFKFFVLKSLKNYRLFYRVFPILSRTAALSAWFFAYFRLPGHMLYTRGDESCLHGSHYWSIWCSVIVDFTMLQWDNEKETGTTSAGLFLWILCILCINRLSYSPLLSLLWLPLPSPVHRKAPAHNGQIHRNNRLCLRSWNADPYNNRTIHS